MNYPVDHNASWLAWLPASLFFFFLAFDFRAEESGGSLVQYVLLAGSLTFGMIGSMTVLRHPHGRLMYPPQLLLVGFLVLFASSSGLLRAHPYDGLLRALVPFVLFAVGGLLAEATVRRNSVFESRVLTVIFVASLVSCAWTYYYVTQVRGVVTLEGRHQFVSATSPQMFAMGLLVFAFGLPQKRLGQLSVLVVAILFALSITRAYLMAALVAVAYLAWVSSARWMSWRSMRAAGVVLAALMVITLGTFFFAPEFFDRWIERLFYERLETGEVTTVVAREAEWRGQINAWMASTNSFIFGRGYGSAFALDEKTLSAIPDYRNSIEYLETITYAGHSYWIGNITAGGFVTGWIMPAILIVALILNFDALIKLRSRLREPSVTQDLVWHSAMGTVYMAAVIAIFVMSFSTNPMGERYVCALYGFTLIASRAHLNRALGLSQLNEQRIAKPRVSQRRSQAH